MSDGGILPQTPITHSQVVTIKPGPKAYQQHLTHCQAVLIRGQPFETSDMVGKYQPSSDGGTLTSRKAAAPSMRTSKIQNGRQGDPKRPAGPGEG